MTSKKVLLYSGGMDSFIIDKLWKPDLKLYVDLKGIYNRTEIEHLPEDVEIAEFDLSACEMKDNYILPLRNLYLLMLACNTAILKYGVNNLDEINLCYGAIKGDNIYDKQLDFMEKAEVLLSNMLQPHYSIPNGIKVKIEKKYKAMSKSDLMKAYKDLGGDIKTIMYDSYSCVSGKEEVCLQCKPCIRKLAALFVGFGEEEFKKLNLDYKKLKEGLDKYDFSYNRGGEEEDIKLLYNFIKENI